MKLTEVTERTAKAPVDMEEIIAALKQLLPSGVKPKLDSTGQAVQFKHAGKNVDVVYRGRKLDLVVNGELIDSFDRKDIDNLTGLERLVKALKSIK